eukprot:scaffold287336_cov26-Prasinocladus_malaysianus.AAC.1
MPEKAAAVIEEPKLFTLFNGLHSKSYREQFGRRGVVPVAGTRGRAPAPGAARAGRPPGRFLATARPCLRCTGGRGLPCRRQPTPKRTQAQTVSHWVLRN